MARGRWSAAVLLAALVSPAAACSWLVDSDVGVRGDGGSEPGQDGSADGDGAAADARDCPVLPGFPPFLDDFSTADLTWAIDPKIQRDGAGALVAGVDGGVLHFVPTSEGNDSAWVKSVEFDFLTGRIAVRVPTLTTDGDSEAYVALVGPGALHKMRFDGSDLHVPGGTSVQYRPDAQVWWQIRSQDYFLHFETSQDGVLWSELDSVPLDFDPTQTRIQIGITVSTAGAASRGELAIDDLNLPPCR